MRIPTQLMFALTVIRDEFITELGFSAKGYGEILLRRIGVCRPIDIYESGGKCFFLINLLKMNVYKKIWMCDIIYIHKAFFCLGSFHMKLYT